MSEDLRCCGSGTCIIDADGRCWCGQQWDGEKMAAPPLQPRGTPGAQVTAKAKAKAIVDPDLESDS
jgi:hypothetical protein